MNKLSIVFTILLSVQCFSLNVYSAPPEPPFKDFITVEINFGGDKPPIQQSVPWHEDITVLECLHFTSRYTSQKAGNNVLVTGIFDVKAEKGQTAWYYKLNGNEANKMPDKQIVESGDHIVWEFKKDLCTTMTKS